MKSSASIRLDLPATTVFAYLADVRNETQWRQSVVNTGYLDAHAPRQGAKGFTEVEMGSKSITMMWEVTAVAPGRYVAWSLDGDPWHGGGSYLVLDQDGSTEVEATLEVRLKGAARFFEPIMAFSLSRGLRQDLARLRACLTENALGEPTIMR